MTSEIPVPETKVEKTKMPVGMIILLVYLGYGVVGGAFGLLQRGSAALQFGFFELSGYPTYAYLLLFVILFGFSFYGILKRLEWGRRLTIGVSVASLLVAAVPLAGFSVNQPGLLESYQEISSVFTESLLLTTLLINFTFNLVINTLIIFYLRKKCDFFTN